MNRETCTDCHTPIPNGHAHARSVSFKRVTLCKPCAIGRGWIAAPALARAS